MNRRQFFPVSLAMIGLPLLPAAGAMAGTPKAITWQPFVSGSEAFLRRKFQGRAFVLAFWSVSCEPCREELSWWARWHQRYPDVGFVLINTDQGDDPATAERLLGLTGARSLNHWVFADEMPERVRWSVDPNWRGELPMTRFYDANHRVKVTLGRLNPDEVDVWLSGAAKARRGTAK